MSSLRTAASATRLLRTASHARTAVFPATRRYESSEVPARTGQEKKETAAAGLPRNVPDYSAPIDMATSYELSQVHLRCSTTDGQRDTH